MMGIVFCFEFVVFSEIHKELDIFSKNSKLKTPN